MDVITPNDKMKLQSLIEKIERLEQEKSNIQADIRDVYADSKSQGYDTKIMKMVIKLRKMEASEREEMEYLVDAYKEMLNI